jgi:hypothetical protein
VGLVKVTSRRSLRLWSENRHCEETCETSNVPNRR